ncbi:type VII secretion-associated serine protease mycosin [Mycolicibacterium duvalii]|uniref:Type VII secretion-associated serine protease n=1 Tax=Mycolicibacterium duvalii TaxID=39688 RepID=A0A7I7K4N8_9MYCO|nr:type VII secretion-associated serine protease mycosin [Mycolicibacterium duvalii]MCV7369004.1 type VII secretion-associated serine protease mycosin [Mycolicibacterium duvalii]PEG44481.1 type VII secretion-associated serine protease mycosin [Mycolicibacterium duvalii]BBX19096.1 type VII secretion-associated serine protease [Mycolicibacterium duvalii]
MVSDRACGTALRRGGAVSAVALLAWALTALPAGAITPPQVDPAVEPPSGSAGPVAPMSQRSPCVTSGVVAGTDPAAAPNLSALKLSEAWRHGRGEGQLVAVIDTGVTPSPRLPNVEPGGDYVEAGDGLTDCDGHGTLVAGLIAGQPGADAFSGVAPAARILAIRQTSQHYSPRSVGEDPELARAAVEVTALASAVVRAADAGARVITIPTAICVPAHRTVDQAALGAALRYAAVERDAVVVAAAGDAGTGTATGATCQSNPLTDPARPSDPRNWDGATTLSIPSLWQPYVLSVGALSTTGGPTSSTMAGPWVGIAAPGERITSVSNDGSGNLANGLPDNDGGFRAVGGTSYAAAYVAGVAALVRSRFPELTAAEVTGRLTGTATGAARTPSNQVGMGGVDPVAALTWTVPARAEVDRAAVRPVAAPPAPPEQDPMPRIVAFAGVGVLALLVLTAVVVRTRRKDPTS